METMCDEVNRLRADACRLTSEVTTTYTLRQDNDALHASVIEKNSEIRRLCELFGYIHDAVVDGL